MLCKPFRSNVSSGLDIVQSVSACFQFSLPLSLLMTISSRKRSGAWISISSVARVKEPAFSLPLICPVKLLTPGIWANGAEVRPANLPSTAIDFSLGLTNRLRFSREPLTSALTSLAACSSGNRPKNRAKSETSCKSSCLINSAIFGRAYRHYDDRKRWAARMAIFYHFSGYPGSLKKNRLYRVANVYWCRW